MRSVLTPNRARLLAAGMGIFLLTSAYYRIHSASIMSEAAQHFLASLTPEQRTRAVFRFEDNERFDWHYIPRERKGLPLRDMTPAQRHLAQAVLASSLSQSGYIKATTIMSLEDVLRVIENDSGERRNPEKYYFSIFGEPAEKGTWAFRVEGHHVSLNFTIANGQVAASPTFFGTNPAEVRQGPRKGLRVLAREEDLGRDLLVALTPEQKKVAIVDATAYPDILTAASRKAAINGQPSGLSISKMTKKQRELLDALVSEYVHDVPDQVADARAEQVRREEDKLYFAWAGVEQRGGPHYYRIQAPSFLIEYDNTQNDANHIHSVWRDFENDFGLDLLKQHYDSSHHAGH
jgi:Protein of unknown function (DUF3500)